MLLQAARDLDLDLASSWMIGDQDRDIVAGRAAGCRTVLLGVNPQVIEQSKPTTAVESFKAAVETIVRHTPPQPPPPPPPLRAERTPVNGSAAPTQLPAAPASVSMVQRPGGPERARDAGEPGQVHRALQELSEEMRMARARRGEFTMLRMLAVGCQLLVLLLALLGLLQLSQMEHFMQWMIGAVLMQLLTIALLLMDTRS